MRMSGAESCLQTAVLWYLPSGCQVCQGPPASPRLSDLLEGLTGLKSSWITSLKSHRVRSAKAQGVCHKVHEVGTRHKLPSVSPTELHGANSTFQAMMHRNRCKVLPPKLLDAGNLCFKYNPVLWTPQELCLISATYTSTSQGTKWCGVTKVLS